MTGLPQLCSQLHFDEDQFHGDSPYAVGASWSARCATASTSPHPQSTLSPDHRPLLGQPWGHAGVLQDDMFPSTDVAGNRQVGGDWEPEGMHPYVENPAAQDQLRDLQHHDHTVPDYARVAQDVAIQAHVAPPAPGIDAFTGDVQQAAAGRASAHLEEVPHQNPVLNGRASEVLRQLALLYLNDPNSQLVTICMGPGNDNEVTVDITLKLTNL